LFSDYWAVAREVVENLDKNLIGGDKMHFPTETISDHLRALGQFVSWVSHGDPIGSVRKDRFHLFLGDP
jgi:hypothetical protein